jgi:hypothetical protein
MGFEIPVSTPDLVRHAEVAAIPPPVRAARDPFAERCPRRSGPLRSLSLSLEYS